MYAENKIGPSEETIAINATTSSMKRDDSSSLIVLVSAVAGGVIGGSIIAALVVWRLRIILAKKVQRISVGRYDELLQSNVSKNISRRQDNQYENVAIDHQYDDLVQERSKQQAARVEDHKYESVEIGNIVEQSDPNPSGAYVTLTDRTAPDYTRIDNKTILSKHVNSIYGLEQFEDTPKKRARATQDYFNLKLS